MAAYASLVSLMRIIDKLLLHPHPPISLHKIQVDSLTEKISFLQEFLEVYNPHLGYSAEADPLETRIADAAYAAEDLIESHIVDRITNENLSSDGLYEGLEKVIQDMASIHKEAMDITHTMGLQHRHHTNSMPPDSLRSSSIMPNSSMVGVDDVLLRMKDKLTSNNRHLQTIPIVGMGGSVFREDEVIRVSRLTKLWVVEGFLKPIKGKSLEEIAKQYFKNLTDRNLILIHKIGSTGSIKKFKMHDLLRELCLQEAEKQRFYIVARQHGVTLITQRRIVISNTSQKEDIDALQFVSLARSLIWDRDKESPPSLNLRLLRIFESTRTIELENMFQFVNLRLLERMYIRDEKLLSSLNRLWNLETLYISTFNGMIRSAEILCMPQIRHVVCEFGARLPDPPSGSQNEIVLENLDKLVGIFDFKCSEEVVKRIPNLKKLGMSVKLDGSSCLNNLVCLRKLVSLQCSFYSKMPLRGPVSVNFPQSLKKLEVQLLRSDCWQAILEKIGSLPLLEKLTLDHGRFEECKWETTEGQFQSLKYLKLFKCDGLKQWTMESSHFPRLEHLVLSWLKEFEEIPLEVAEIPTLGWIKLRCCGESAAMSARRIVEEQEESTGEADIQVRVISQGKNKAVESLASHPNIRVEIW